MPRKGSTGGSTGRPPASDTGQVSLSLRKKVFVESYLQNGRNATQAALAAGYSAKTAASQGSRLAKSVEIQQEINRRTLEVVEPLEQTTELTLTRLIAELACIAFFDPATMFGEDGKLLSIKQMPEATRRALSGFEIEQYTQEDGEALLKVVTAKLRQWSKPDAIEQLLKLGGHLKERVEHEGAIEIVWASAESGDES